MKHPNARKWWLWVLVLSLAVNSAWAQVRVVPTTTYSRGLLTNTTAAESRTYLGVGTAAELLAGTNNFTGLTNSFTGYKVGFGVTNPIARMANSSAPMAGGLTPATNGLAWEVAENSYAAVISGYPASGAGYGLRLHTLGATASDYPLFISSGSGVGTGRVAVDGQGYLGLGTTTPNNLLTLKHNSAIARFINGGNVTMGFVGGTAGLIGTANTNWLTVRAESGLVLSGSGNLADVNITGSKTGFGTAAPQYVVDVNGSMRIIGTNAGYYGGTVGAADATSYIQEASAGVLQARGTSAIRLWGNTVAGSANGVTPLASLHASGSGSALIFVANSQGNSPTAPLGAFAINGTNVVTVMSNATFQIRGTLTGAGTTGAQTINKPVGSVNLAAGATSLVVTDSCVGTASDTIVLLTVGSNDTTCKSAAVVVGTGSFTIYPSAAPTAETVVYFQVIRVSNP